MGSGFDSTLRPFPSPCLYCEQGLPRRGGRAGARDRNGSHGHGVRGPAPSARTSAFSPPAQGPTQATPIAAKLLLDVDDVGAVMKASMADEGPPADLPDTGVTVTPARCTGAFDPFDA